MSVIPVLIVDGDDANNASLDGVFTPLQDGINGVVGYGTNMRRGALGVAHAGKLFASEDPITVESEGEYQTYDFATFGVSITYNAYGDDGGTETAASYTGDRAIAGHPDCAGYTGSLAKVTFTKVGGYKLGQSRGHLCASILILWNVELSKTTNNAVAGMEVMTCLQFRTTNGNWYTIDRTERFVSIDDHKIDTAQNAEIISYDIPIATQLVAADIVAQGLSPTTQLVTAVRAMVSLKGAAAGTSFTIHRWKLTAGPLYTSEVA